MAGRCGPVLAPVVVDRVAGPDTLITLDVEPREPVFRGHYPGFPIFPGVCIVDFVERGALEAHPEPGRQWRVSGVDKVRFSDPVRPGDRLTAQLNWRDDGGSWRCAATVATDRGPAARLTLVFTERGAA
ncbi:MULTISPECIES: 3-hydroxyacyl-ACP dehydratase FabZ family protein [Streptomyces]|uniref:3-hydroxyacyl-ACP dehydratase FabZ family protein n=1 Tax=Streptomyces TaxID=1883 RepID=UPI001E3B702A|nr:MULTISPECIES: hypothetical protein [Streptomyces]UFQ16223.1 hypothetical protein J2N69_15140 [Streptomyces huasconensis]WCL85827.1 hypothetical protein PPN52_15150 [Streptomyces sp. JCM 35825]